MKKNEKKVENAVLYDRITSAGQKKGYSSASAVAKAIGASETSAANRWKSGSSIISDHLLKLSKCLGVSIDYLLGNDEYVSTVLSEQEAEILAVYRRLDMRNRILLHAHAYELEDSENAIGKTAGEKDTQVSMAG